MPRLCERPGCSVPASVAYGFEAERFLVWVEGVPADRAEEIRSGVLCRRHADALTPPRGWWLDDRRQPRPQLFRVVEPAGEPALPVHSAEAADQQVVSAAAAERRRSLRKSKRRADLTTELPFDAIIAAAAMIPETPPGIDKAEVGNAGNAGQSGNDGQSGIDGTAGNAGCVAAADEVSDQAGAGTAADAAVTAPMTSTPVDLPDPDETKVIPWSPRFDQSDDLDGLLDVRSPLLSRAFRGKRGESRR